MATELINHKTLLTRYTPLSADGDQPLSKRALHNWRKNKGFPDPIISSPSLVWSVEDVITWEKKQGYDFLH
ncbi:hypothetical protein K6U20_11960 [Vibrio fluvialis]|uniref:hypothetical protein n=1 Tax=Vibrio fluvialis TaxID=676 RepID=UPI001EEBA948|nr:hypothetical protein [Vibrio fluvialis]MCG6405338.1 hypothetical protein [Vibrio fluvialis]WDY54319.1 hypothetical protein PUN47_20940 [Vibrio fluvialis]